MDSMGFDSFLSRFSLSPAFPQRGGRQFSLYFLISSQYRRAACSVLLSPYW